MADIQSLISGRTYWRLDDGIATLLLDTFPDKFKRYEKPPKPAPVPAWSLYRGDYGVCGLCVNIGSETLIVSGPANGIVDRCQRALAGRKAPLPSDDLVKEYAREAMPTAQQPIPAYRGRLGVSENENV